MCIDSPNPSCLQRLRPLVAALLISAIGFSLSTPSVATTVPAAAPLWENNLDNPARADRSLASAGWQIIHANTLSDPLTFAPKNATANKYGVLNGGGGSDTPSTPGYLWTSLGANQLRIWFTPVPATKLPPLTLAAIKGKTLSFDAVASTAGIATLHPVIQLDGRDWYLSTAEFAPLAVGNKKSFSDASSPAEYRRALSLATDAAAWTRLTITDGTPLAFAPLDAPLPDTATLTAIGILARNAHAGKGGVTLRIDTFRIE